jgi:molybdopterin converting factor small subunit
MVAKTVRLSATLRQVAGTNQVAVDMPPGSTVRSLLQSLKAANPSLGAYILAPDGNLNAGILMLIDGRHIDFLQGLDSSIDQAKDVMLIPPVLGG